MADTFDDMLARAAHRGTLDANYALAYGGVMDAPLSGEWADQLTPHTLALALGYDGDDGDDIDALADAYESAYFARVAEDDAPYCDNA